MTQTTESLTNEVERLKRDVALGEKKIADLEWGIKQERSKLTMLREGIKQLVEKL